MFSEMLSNREHFTPLHPYLYVNGTKNNVTHLFLSNLQLNCRGWEVILNRAFSCIPGMHKHAFPFLRGISHTSASSQPLEVCLCRGGGIVRTTRCRPLTRLVISIKGGSRSFVSIFSSCFFSTVQTLVRWIFFFFFFASQTPHSTSIISCYCLTLLPYPTQCPWHANLSPWFHFGEMVSGVVKRPALCHRPPRPASSIPAHLRLLLLPYGWGAPQSGWTGFEFN